MLTRIREGDEAAFEALYRAMHAPLLAFVARYVGDDARAEELVQDLFLDLWRGRATLAVHGSIRAYLFSAARNRALNVRRRDTVEQDWSADESRDEVRALHPAPPAADAALDTAELLERLQRALAALPERCAMVMHLRWRDGLSHAEIAAIMQISIKGVERQIGRGLQSLRTRLGGR